jgi:hypothetical protein
VMRDWQGQLRPSAQPRTRICVESDTGPYTNKQ